MIHWILDIHTFASGIMTGLVWFVQINHYPLFLRIGSQDFPEYEREHVRRTGWIVAPTMLLELTSCVTLAYLHPSVWITYFSPALIVGIWLSTFLVQMPLHGKLQKKGKLNDSIQLLIYSNWLRTLSWTAVFAGLILNR